MKKTGAVQGLRSLADKIHPNGYAPLTTSESKGLLTALTSSFRKHLDAAHPTTIDDGRKNSSKATGLSPDVNINSIHSSAIFAQKHMASVLTNPLLVRGAKSYGSAKVELQKDSYRDPIQLLEDYDREGAASVRIAQLCMETLKKKYDSVPDARKPKLLEEIQPGRRVLMWLLERGMYQTDFSSNLPFVDLLVFFLAREGREDNIWKWLKLDVQIPDSTEGAPWDTQVSVKKRMLYKYRWRGCVLDSLVQAQVDVPWLADSSGKLHIIRASHLNSALNTLVTALELRTSSTDVDPHPENWHHLAWLPLAKTSSFLVRLLTRRLRSSNPRGDVELQKGDILDPQLYDKLIEYVSFTFDFDNKDLRRGKGAQVQEFFKMMRAATLHLTHPTRPSADPMLKMFTWSCQTTPRSVLRSLKSTWPSQRMCVIYTILRSSSALMSLKPKADARTSSGQGRGSHYIFPSSHTTTIPSSASPRERERLRLHLLKTTKLAIHCFPVLRDLFLESRHVHYTRYK